MPGLAEMPQMFHCRSIYVGNARFVAKRFFPSRKKALTETCGFETLKASAGT
jgi:hypothetical protein